MYGHPRAGNNFLMALLAKNFYDGIDLSGEVVGFGHWTRKNEVGMYVDGKERYAGINKYGKLAGSHANLKSALEDSIYITRDCRAVWVSIWCNNIFRRKEDDDVSFKDFMWRQLDWYWDFNNEAVIRQMPIIHWYYYILSWSAKIYTVKWEDLVLRLFDVLANIEEHYGLIRSHKDFQLVDGLVGWFPRNPSELYNHVSSINPHPNIPSIHLSPPFFARYDALNE